MSGGRERPLLAVIGGGMTAHRLCERLVSLGVSERARVIVFAEERGPAYDRVQLSAIVGGRAPDSLALRPLAWYAANGVEWREGDRVERVDSESRIVATERGHALRCHAIVLATGSRALVPDVRAPRCRASTRTGLARTCSRWRRASVARGEAAPQYSAGSSWASRPWPETSEAQAADRARS
jgi:NAD(P)H-nitrite reductase large subunit